MYSKNITTFLAHLLGKDGASQATLPINPDDEITRETLLTRGGAVVHPRVKDSVTSHVAPEQLQKQPKTSFTFRILPGSIKTMGRSTGAEFIVDAAMVSRLHCRLTAGATELEVVDLDSTNGTFVNGKRVTRARARTPAIGSASVASSSSSRVQPPLPPTREPRLGGSDARLSGEGVVCVFL